MYVCKKRTRMRYLGRFVALLSREQSVCDLCHTCDGWLCSCSQLVSSEQAWDICEVPFFKKSWSPWVRGFALGGGGRDIHPSMEKGGRENVACRDRRTAGEIGE